MKVKELIDEIRKELVLLNRHDETLITTFDAVGKDVKRVKIQLDSFAHAQAMFYKQTDNKLKAIARRLDLIEQPRIFEIPKGELDSIALALPDHLRKTWLTILKLKEATADEVAQFTHRARALESGYLNRLTRTGHLRKRRDGRKVIFYL